MSNWPIQLLSIQYLVRLKQRGLVGQAHTIMALLYGDYEKELYRAARVSCVNNWRVMGQHMIDHDDGRWETATIPLVYNAICYMLNVCLAV